MIASISHQLSTNNQQSLQRLLKILNFAEGHTLLFACCNAPSLQDQLIAAATAALAESTTIHTLAFTDPTSDLVDHIRAALPILVDDNQPALLFITGLEFSIPFDTPDAPMLAELNLGRELIQLAAPLPIIFWLPDYAITSLARYALDFWSWRSGLFEFETDQAHHQQSHERYVQQDRGWLGINNLTVEQKLRRRRILEGLLADYERAVDPENGKFSSIQATHQELLEIYQQLGLIHMVLQEYPAALHYYNMALPLRQQVGDKDGEATTLSNMGHVYDDLGDKEEALRYYNMALPLQQQVGSKGGEANTLNNMGCVYDDLGDKEEALSYYNMALPLQQQVGNKLGEAITLSNMGHVYSSLGDKEEALRYYKMALPLQQQVGDKLGEAITLSNMGLVYDDLGEKKEALRYYNIALPIDQEVGNKAAEAITLNNMGRVYDDLGNKKEALRYYNIALPLSQQVGDKHGEAAILSNMGRVYSSLGDKQGALLYYNMALSLDQQVRDRWGESAIRYNMALTYRDMGMLREAVEQLEQAIAIKEDVGHPDLERDRKMLERVQAMLESDHEGNSE